MLIVDNTKYNLSQRQLEGYSKYCELIRWGRRNPVQFAEEVFGIMFLDAQAYVYANMYYTPFVCVCASRNSGKSTISAPLLMEKSILIPNHTSYIISGNASQAHETFLKIEKIARKQISSFVGLTDFFQSEIVISNTSKNGFVHSANDFNFSVFNGSSVHTVTSNYDGERGKRSNLNLYDETGFLDRNAFASTEPFTSQESNFALGKKDGEMIDLSCEPLKNPNQLIYLSSASDVTTYFYEKYKTFAKNMFMGNKDYFCADIGCELVLNPMVHGKVYPVPLLTQAKIDQKMRENPEEGLREYYNKFTKDGGDGQPFKRASILRNSEPIKPLLRNEGNKKRHIGLFYDPARSFDNSICLVGEFWEDESPKKKGWMGRVVNCVSFVDIGKHKKTPMRTPEQIDMIKEMLVGYNGEGYTDYENIGVLMIDSGSGGAGVPIADFFMEDWVDSEGITRKGLIDPIESKDYIHKFPTAVKKIQLISPRKYKTDMFDALVDMLENDYIIFPEKYEGEGSLMLPVEREVETEDGKTHKKRKEKEIEYEKVELDFEEDLSLRNIDLMKTEIVNMYRYDNADKTTHTYRLPPDKINTWHDDRAYCLAMFGWYLMCLRSNTIRNKKTEGFNVKRAIKMRVPKTHY